MSKVTVIIIKDANTKPWQMTGQTGTRGMFATSHNIQLVLLTNCQAARKYGSLTRNHLLTLSLRGASSQAGQFKSHAKSPWIPSVCTRRPAPSLRPRRDQTSRRELRLGAEFWQRDLPRLHRNPYVSAIVSCPAPVWARWHHLALSRWNIAAGIE